MMRTHWTLVLAATLSLAVGGQAALAQEEQAAPAAPVAPAAPSVTFEQLRRNVQALRAEEQQLAEQRESTAREQLVRQENAAREQEARRDREEARSNELNADYEYNRTRIEELTVLLAQKQGTLGELFGVSRQVAGDAANVLQASMLTAQFAPTQQGEERVEFLREVAGAQELPSIVELERLWYELQREMTDAAKVQRFQAGILQISAEPGETQAEAVAEAMSPTVAEAAVVRIGPFTAVSGGDYLGYLPSSKAFSVLDGHLPAAFRTMARNLEAAPAGSGHVRAMVDPARGALLGLYLERPNTVERIQHGESVGYLILAVGGFGIAVALFQYIYLFLARMAVARQLRNMNQPRKDNPLGRVLAAFREGGRPGEPRELAELRLSEAVLRELPKLERFQSLLRLAVAAGPLLGLIGTVIGMILTFKAITAAGTSDPKLMARGIGQAMIATVLGLGIAIPLLFINAGLQAFSRGITQILDEQTHELLAEKSSRRG